MSEPISKDSTMKIGLVLSGVAAAVAVTMYASRMMSTVEQAGKDITQIKIQQERQWEFTRSVYEKSILNDARITSLEKSGGAGK